MELISSEPAVLIALACIVVIAAVVRGCLGFGFSALVVAAGALFVSPALLVPVVILLEIAASAQMLPKALPEVHWRSHNNLLVALALTTPLGVYLLSVAPDKTLRLAVACLVLFLSLLQLSGRKWQGTLRRPVLFAVGLVAGLFNGIAGLGGMPMAIFLSSTAMPLAQVRATLVMLFFSTEAIFVLSAWWNDLYSVTLVLSALVALLPMALGIALGERLYARIDEQRLRRAVVWGIFSLAVLGLLNAVA